MFSTPSAMPLAGERRADVVLRDERGKLVVGDFGVDGHRAPAQRQEESGRILTKLCDGGEPPRRLARRVGQHRNLGEAGRIRGGARGRGHGERCGERVGHGGAGRDHRGPARRPVPACRSRGRTGGGGGRSARTGWRCPPRWRRHGRQGRWCGRWSPAPPRGAGRLARGAHRDDGRAPGSSPMSSRTSPMPAPSRRAATRSVM